MLAMSTSCGASFPRAGKPIAGALTELSGLILCAAGFVPKLGHFPEYMRIVQDEQGRILVARQEKGLGFLVRGKQGVFGVAAGFRSGGSLPHGVLHPGQRGGRLYAGRGSGDRRAGLGAARRTSPLTWPCAWGAGGQGGRYGGGSRLDRKAGIGNNIPNRQLRKAGKT